MCSQCSNEMELTEYLIAGKVYCEECLKLYETVGREVIDYETTMEPQSNVSKPQNH